MLTKYYSGDQIETNEMGGACSTYGGEQGVLVGKYEEKRPLGIPRRRWENNIKMDILEAGCGGMDWINRAQDTNRWRTFVNAVVNFRVP